LTTLPIIAIDLESDPVGAGFIASFARPGGNITGIFLDFPDFSKKWLELLKEAVPSASLISIFWDPASGPLQIRAAEAAATALKLNVLRHEVGTSADLERAFQVANAKGASALLILPSPLVGGNSKLLAELTAAHRLPAVSLFTDFARQGGLLAYGPNLLTYYRQQGVLIAKLLHGASPAETPVERPTKFEFVLNLKTADTLGITVPPAILLRADEVIE
jgi:putative ABC transport system substrate-binding protein